MSEYAILPAAVDVREVGPRAGLQDEDPIPAGEKIRLVDALSRTGLSRIQIGSFVRPDVVPQMADVQAVISGINRREEIRYSALVPNLAGARLALSTGIRDIDVLVSASDTHSRRTIGRETDESLAELGETVRMVHDAGGTVDVLVATAWGCPYEGEIARSRVLSVAFAAVTEGADALTLSDTTGMGTPVRVEESLLKVSEMFPDVPLGVHFSDTRGTGLANVYAALLMGITRFDASIGGLGGSPFEPGATGNVATEELVAMVSDMEVSTGIDLGALLDAASYAQLIVGKPLPSRVLIAGPRTQLVPID